MMRIVKMTIRCYTTSVKSPAAISLKRALLKKLPTPESGPKKPLSAYMLFAKDKGAALFASDSTLPAREKLGKVGASLGAAWKALPEHEKLAYEESSAKSKKSYESALKTFLEQRDPKDAFLAEYRYRLATAIRGGKTVKKQITKPLKDIAKPKRPLSAFFLFSQHVNSLSLSDQEAHVGVSLADKPLTERTKIVSNAYKALSAAAKEPFEAKAEKLKSEYQVAVKEYSAKLEDIKNTIKGVEKEIIKQKKPKKRSVAIKPVKKAVKKVIKKKVVKKAVKKPVKKPVKKSVKKKPATGKKVKGRSVSKKR